MTSSFFILLIYLIALTIGNCIELSSVPPYSSMRNFANGSKQVVIGTFTDIDYDEWSTTASADNWENPYENTSESVTSLSASTFRTVGSVSEKQYKALTCPGGFTYYEIDCEVSPICYKKEEVDYPYECQYVDYAQIGHTFPAGGPHYLTKRDPLYGYYEIRQPGLFYRKLVSTSDFDIPTAQTIEWLECVVGWTSGCEMAELRVQNCNNGQVYGTCFYDGYEYNFCRNFMEICDATCSCVEYENRFSCETKNCNSSDCTACIEKFESYPSPQVTLKRMGSYIYVMVKNPLKLAQKYEPELHCFSENDGSNSEGLWQKHTLLPEFESLDSYVMAFYHGGLYWCEYFTYPNMEVMSSDEFFFQYENVLSFIVNVTVKLDMDPHSGPSFLSFEIPGTTLSQLQYVLFAVGIHTANLYLVRIYPIQHSDNTTNFTYRINLNDRPEQDMLLIYDELMDALSELTRNKFAVSYTLASADMCLEISEPTLTFPTTRIGDVAKPIDTVMVDENGLPITRRCLGSYADGAFWGEFNSDISVGELSPISDDLLSLLSQNISAEERNTNLKEIIHDGSDAVIPFDIYLVSQIMQQIVSSGDPVDVTTYANNVNSVMRFPNEILSKSQQSLNATDTILYNFDLMLARIANQKRTRSSELPSHIESDLILAQVADIQASKVNGVAIYKREGKYVMESLKKVSSFDQVDFSELIFATYLPPAFLELLAMIHPGDPHLVTAFFLNDALFDPEGKETTAEYAVSLFVPDLQFHSHRNLSIPMYFNVMGENRTCALWRYGIDSQLRGIFGSWERQYEALDANGTFCHFEHTTHFALLVNAPTNKGLNILNHVASIASIIGTCLIFTTAIAFPKWREQSGTIVLVNYSVSVLSQHILLFLFEFNSDNHGVFCKIIGVLSHYVILVQFCWILVISYIQYFRLVVVFGTHPKDFLAAICISVWLIPVIPVGIVVGVSLSDYACFLEGDSFHFALALPISVIVLVNMVIFGRILYSLFCSNVKIPGKGNELQRVSVCIILFFLTGFTWIFGLMANFFNAIVLSYIFCVLTAFHGLILCIYFILLQHYTRKMWVQKLCMNCCGNFAYKKGNFSNTQSN